MILIAVLIIISVLFYYGSEMFRDIRLIKVLNVFLGILLFYLFLFNVKYNSDWDVYEAMYNGYLLSNDFMFNTIAQYFNTKGFEYENVYQLHIFLMSVGFICFISHFSKNSVFIVVSLYLLFQIVPLSNQIRYFVAFAFYLLAIYELIVNKRFLLFVLLALFSLLSHSAIVLMFPFIYYFYKVDVNILLKRLIQSSFILFLIFLLFYAVGLVLFSHFMSYFEEEMISSFNGGVFNSIILLIWIIYIVKNHNRHINKGNHQVNEDVKYQFLYKLSVYTIVFLVSGVFLQVLSHRFIASSFVVWIIYCVYSSGFEVDYLNRIKRLTLLLVLSVLTFFYIYILPKLILGVDSTEQVLELFESNTLFN